MEAFYADFSSSVALNSKDWVISHYAAPHHGQAQTSRFDRSHVSIQDGALKLTLKQVKNKDGSITSIGGEVLTTRSFSYGTYKVVARVSSTAEHPTAKGSSVSGSITGFFNYWGAPPLPPSAAEIDIELEGAPERSTLIHLTSWSMNLTRESEVSKVKSAEPPYEGFHTYAFVWKPGSVRYYKDGVELKTHVKVVPNLAAPFCINHWGTNNKDWGGLATPGVERHVWVKSFSYKPL